MSYTGWRRLYPLAGTQAIPRAFAGSGSTILDRGWDEQAHSRQCPLQGRDHGLLNPGHRQS